MAYNSTNAVEGKFDAKLPPDQILDGAIIGINDGVVKDFIQNTAKWQGSEDNPAIEVVVEVNIGTVEVKKFEQIKHVFTYENDSDGKTVYRGALKKFKEKYSDLPRPGIAVKVITNSKGFGKIKLD